MPTTSNLSKPVTAAELKAFAKRLRGRYVAFLEETGADLAALYARDTSVIDRLLATGAVPSRDLLMDLVKVGQRTLHPTIAVTNSPVTNRLRKLPYAVQAAAVKRGTIEVRNHTGGVTEVPLAKVSGADAKRIVNYGEGRILPASEQPTPPAPQYAPGPVFVIENGALVALRKGSVTITKELIKELKNAVR